MRWPLPFKIQAALRSLLPLKQQVLMLATQWHPMVWDLKDRCACSHLRQTKILLCTSASIVSHPEKKLHRTVHTLTVIMCLIQIEVWNVMYIPPEYLIYSSNQAQFHRKCIAFQFRPLVTHLMKQEKLILCELVEIFLSFIMPWILEGSPWKLRHTPMPFKVLPTG